MRGNYVLNKGQILGSAYCPLHRSLTMAWRLGVFNLPLTLLMRLYRRACGFSQPMIKFTFIHSLQVFKTPEEDYEVIPILKSLTPPSPGKLATFPGSPSLFEQWYGFFYVPKGPDK